MRAYLDALDDDPFVSPDGTSARRAPVSRVIAALRPPMLRLARDRAQGAHTFLVPVEHTRRARALLGPGPLLVPEQKVLLETDPRAARERGRGALAWYLDTPNYLDNLRSLGFSDSDFADGGSERLVDTLVAWGDEERVLGRLREHLAAGADQVAVHPLGDESDPLGLDLLRALAPALAATR
jgi:probable F420-dependent oxidoreductase